MSDDFEDFTAWPPAMGSRVATLEAASDAHAVKIGDHGGLLTAMDKDVSDAQAAFRAQLGVLNAVRETQSEQTTLLREHGTLLREHGTRLAKLEIGQEKVLAGVQAILGLLQSADGGEKPGWNSPN
ncbi:MAG: hypothetical protein ACRDOI_45985 [Trebonia sp.]